MEKQNYSRTDSVDHPPEQELKKVLAVCTIEKVYLAYRDKQMFTLLKHAVCAAEKSWTYDILRKISPLEATLLRDPSIKARVRLRFAGTEFPPIIVFKICLVGEGTKYISGRRVIQPASAAATDACNLMGFRKFYDQMIVDACQYEKYKITDEVDVTTMQDYMQYLSNMDETPSYLGGKENYWRQLTLEALPRQSIMYDIVEYLQTKSPSDRLRSEMPTMMSRPLTQEIQLEHIRALSRLQTPYDYNMSHFNPPRRNTTPNSRSQRRSTQARQRVSKMRKLYAINTTGSQGLQEIPKSQEKNRLTEEPASDHVMSWHLKPEMGKMVDYSESCLSDDQQVILQHSIIPSAGGNNNDVEDLEAEELFEWTQSLNYDDINRISRSRTDSGLRSRSYSSRPIQTAPGL